MRASVRKRSHSGTAAASGHQKGLPPTVSQSQRARSISSGPIFTIAPRMRKPSPQAAFRTCRATAPAATRMAVSRAEARPLPR